MPRRKKNNLKRYNDQKKSASESESVASAQFKPPPSRAVSEARSSGSSLASTRTSLLSETNSVTTRSMSKRLRSSAGNSVPLPITNEPVNVTVWAEEARQFQAAISGAKQSDPESPASRAGIKRPRGRPRKTPNLITPTLSQQASAAYALASPNDGKQPLQGPLTQNGGQNAAASVNSSNGTSVPKKRPRGRPRKNQTQTTVTSTPSSRLPCEESETSLAGQTDELNSNQTDCTLPKKRPRGRPRQNQTQATVASTTQSRPPREQSDTSQAGQPDELNTPLTSHRKKNSISARELESLNLTNAPPPALHHTRVTRTVMSGKETDGARTPKDTSGRFRKKTSDPTRCTSPVRRPIQRPQTPPQSPPPFADSESVYSDRTLRRSARNVNTRPQIQPVAATQSGSTQSQSSADPNVDDGRDPDWEPPRQSNNTVNPRPVATVDDNIPDFRRPNTPPAEFRNMNDERNYRRAVRNGTFNIARGPPPIEIERFSLGACGEPEYVCTNCLAIFYEGEVDPAQNPFSKCCERGKVPYDKDAPPYPEELLILVRENVKHLRLLNNRLSLAAYKAKRVHLDGFPWIYKTYGQSRMTLDNADPLPNPAEANFEPNRPGPNDRRQLNDVHLRSNAQLVAIVDPATATEAIVNAPGGDKLKPEVVEAFLTWLQENNPLYRMYTNMETLLNEQLAAGEEGRVTLVFKEPGKDNVTLKQHTHAVPRHESEVAVLYDVVGEPATPGIYVHQHGANFEVLPTHPLRDAFAYPLINPRGTFGWHPNIKHQGPNATNIRNRVTMRQYYRQRLMRRDPLQPELASGGLTQQAIIEFWLKIEDSDLHYLRSQMPQDLMISSRGHMLALLERTVQRQRDQGVRCEAGRSFVLPTSFRGGDIEMQRLYRHCIASIRKTGAPNFFWTMTADPKHRDVLNHPSYRPNDDSLNADLVCRVFYMQVRDFQDQLFNKKVWGTVKNYVQVTEFLKRGLPHIHCVITTDRKILTPDDVDEFVTCELADPNVHPDFHRVQVKHNIHRLCGPQCKNKKGVCKRGYRKRFRDATTLDDGKGFVEPRRRDLGFFVVILNFTYTNQDTVGTNIYFAVRYEIHSNLNIFVNIRQAKYVFKYVTKGVDKATVEVTYQKYGHRIRNPDNPNATDRVFLSMRMTGNPETGENVQILIDELKMHQETRYMTVMQAIWRIFAFEMQKSFFAVVELNVHLPEDTPIVFRAGTELNAASRPLKHTPFLAYFDLNAQTVDPVEVAWLTTIKFEEVPERYRFDDKAHKWILREVTTKPVIGSIYTVSPKNRERFYLRALVMARCAPRSYADLRTVDGVLYDTFREAAVALGLVRDDAEYQRCLDEATLGSTPFSMRLLFLMILLHCAPTDPKALFEQFWRSMAGEFERRGLQAEDVRNRLLRYFARKLKLNNAQLDVSLFQGVDLEGDADVLEFDEAAQADALPTDAELIATTSLLNEQQSRVVQTLVRAVDVYKSGVGRVDSLYFVEGPAGTGKTFTYKVLYDTLVKSGKKVLCMSFTGVAASLLPCGRTLHSALGLPVPLDAKSESRLEPHMDSYKALKDADLLIIDEVSMGPVHAYNIANKLVRRAKNCKEFDDPEFGGVPVLFGGDFRQLAPICGDNETEREIHFRYSRLFEKCTVISLEKNMRANPQELEFAKLLRSIGEGTAPTHPSLPPNSFIVPREWVIESSKLEDLLQWTFGEDPATSGKEACVLTHLNDNCRLVNSMVLQQLPGDVTHLLSDDSIEDDDPDDPILNGDYGNGRMPVLLEELNDHTDNSIPDHSIPMKKGAVIILMRNIDVSSGLVNGTRISVSDFSRTRIRGTVLSGSDNIKGRVVDVTRIDFFCDVGALHRMKRAQFPIKLAFAMTINKAQGLTLKRVGLYLPNYLEEHGKPYVGLSRVKSPDDIKLLILKDTRQGYCREIGQWFTHNPVRRELWDLHMERRPPAPQQPQPPAPALNIYQRIHQLVGQDHDGHEDEDNIVEDDCGVSQIIAPSPIPSPPRTPEVQQQEAPSPQLFCTPQSSPTVPLEGVGQMVTCAKAIRINQLSAADLRRMQVVSHASRPTKTLDRSAMIEVARATRKFPHDRRTLLSATARRDEQPQDSPPLASPDGSPVVTHPEPLDLEIQPDIDFLRKKVHDRRLSRSEPTASPQVVPLSQDSSFSVPAIVDSDMTKRTFQSDELCANENCEFCVRLRKQGITECPSYMVLDPEMESALTDLGLFQDPDPNDVYDDPYDIVDVLTGHDL
ncbi:uncharacterized protein LOC132203177 isoform X2 [Neocloeon triangulifer]|uniref:uncharacterized protein LOC132203177 isoform X2 n=1 Tax=Neocloeon triangulifer TaxID=2078957 RepID=UPI00286EF5E7|nr:uncharacterized protein LOC132203177 isoform X2 [Neocloeon triangulifer]